MLKRATMSLGARMPLGGLLKSGALMQNNSSPNDGLHPKATFAVNHKVNGLYST